ncbi:hypothetical protein BT96DRAFT_920144 [Gymnopus androsaceus JB14]|uniref:Uncharacterized protein n=1 Tax=Gymnopus androsaceus JB14 TaxID=1447944 RepID=A0A6A4HQ73_9AGAR|nr:hypothetical protein BT96DRAFT_920144 [Gymnopus androsaceus JB14]
MIAFWYLLLFCWSVISSAKPLVAPRLSESSYLVGIGSSEFSSHSIPPPPSFLSPYSRSMSSFAVFPLLAYSTLLAVFAQWRRKRGPSALALEDDGVELLPTNTSTLSPRFKDLPVPPPLPSPPVPSHAHLSERPKSPLHFGPLISRCRFPSQIQTKSYDAKNLFDVHLSLTPSQIAMLMPLPLLPRRTHHSRHKPSLVLWLTSQHMFGVSLQRHIHILPMWKARSLWRQSQNSFVPVSEFRELDTADLDVDADVGYEQDVESGEKGKEIDIGWEWGFESVTSLSTRVSSHPAPVEEEQDLVSETSPIDPTAALENVRLHPIPITASSSSSDYIRPLERQVDLEEEGETEPWLMDRHTAAASEFPASLAVLDADAGHPIEILVTEDTDAQDVKISDDDNGTLPSFGRDDTSLDSDLIQRVYISDAEVEPSADAPAASKADSMDIGQVDVFEDHSQGQVDDDNNDVYDVYENNDCGEDEGLEDEDAGLEKGDVSDKVEDEVVDASPSTDSAVTLVATSTDLQEVAAPLTPAPSQEILAALDDHQDESQSNDDDSLDSAEDHKEAIVKDDEEQHVAKAGESAFSTGVMQIPTPPASPPQQRRALPRPAWSVRAADAPPLGLPSSTSSPILLRKLSFQDMMANLSSDVATVGTSEPNEKQDAKEQGDRPDTPVPEPKTATLPGAFPVDLHPLADKDASSSLTSPTTDSSGAQDTITGTTTALEVASTTKPTRRQLGRSPIDIALAMQLRPGLGLGADPAWMVRFLMAMFGWFVVLISGSAGDGYAKAPYVGIRRSSSSG